MIPLRDSVRTRRTAWVNLGIIGAAVGIFLWEIGTPGSPEVVLALAVRPAEIFDLGHLVRARFLPLGTLISATFLHGGWLHLLGNMLYLWIFGDAVEAALGPGRYLAFYLLGGLVANLAHVLANPFSTVPTIGASGAVAAVLGGYLVTYPGARVLALVPVGVFLPLLRLPAWGALGFWFLLQLWGGLVGMGAQGVAWWAHIGGFLAGMALVRILAPGQEDRSGGGREVPTGYGGVDVAESGRIAGLDVGDRTIGVAVSDPLGWTAQGVTVIRRESLDKDLARLEAICGQYGVTRLVVGLPRNMNGTEGPRAEAVRAFAREVEARLGLPVTLWDERLTTMQAERALLEADLSRARRRQVIDRLAAQLILQSFLDHQAARRREREEPQP